MKHFSSLSRFPLWVQSSLGPAAILLLFVTSVLFGMANLNKVADNVDLLNTVGQLAETIYKAQDFQDAYLLHENSDSVEGFNDHIDHAMALVSELESGVHDTTLRRDLGELRSVLLGYDKAFDQVYQYTLAMAALKKKTFNAYNTITQVLLQDIKGPLEIKKNNALATGEELDPYDQELLSSTDRLYSLTMAALLDDTNYFQRLNIEDALRFKEHMEAIKIAFDDWSFIVTTMEDATMKAGLPVLQAAFTDYSLETFDQRLHLKDRIRDITTSMLSQKDAGMKLIAAFNQRTKALTEAAKDGGSRNMTIFLALGVVLGLGISILAARSISQPISAILARLKDIAQGEGDLTKRLQIDRADELGQQARWFNRFVENIRDMIKSMVAITGQLNRSSTLLTEVAGRMSDSTEQMKSKSNLVVTSTATMSHSTRSVASTMEQSSSSMEVIVRSTEEMNTGITAISKKSDEARNIAANTVSLTEKASRQVNELGEAAKHIGDVTDTIRDISDQTNLLALNATIEAARAGEAGRGFAVVANEIKTLADQTAMATREIAERVENIQGATQGAVGRIFEVSSVIGDVDEIISSISTAITEQTTLSRNIGNNVADASAGIDAISRHIHEAAQEAESVSADIGQVDQSAGDISRDGMEVDKSARKLLMLAGELKTMVDRFIVD